jgi:hypothetical protein
MAMHVKARRCLKHQSGAFTAALALLLALFCLLQPRPAGASSSSSYRCDGEELRAQVQAGAVDAPDIPNRAGGTLPGAFVVLHWRGISLQLPRTNNAGAPSFSDGKWWWSLEDPEHPNFQLRRGTGTLERFHCEAITDATTDRPADAIPGKIRTEPSESPPPRR